MLVSQYVRKGTKAAIAYTANGKGNYVELPIQNYLGYRAKDEAGNKVEILQGDGGRIRLRLCEDGAEHRIYVRYGPVAAFVFAEAVSALTIAGIALWQFGRRRSRPETLS